MVSETAILIGFGMFLVVVSIGFFLWILWDRGKVAIEYRDQETGDVGYVKARPTEEGVKFDHSKYPTHMVRPDARKMGTWHGSVMPWTYPLITIDPHSGRQFAEREMVRGDPDMPEELQEVEPELIAVPWAHVYWNWIDSNVIEEAIEAQKPAWARMQGALIVGMIVMALAFLGSVYFSTAASGGA